MPEQPADRSTTVRVLRASLAVLLIAAVVKSAWICEDSHITLRTIDNFWRGYGLRWNVLERVQTYTHPLWMLIVGAANGVTREAAYTTIAVGMGCTLAMVGVLLRTLPPVRSILALGLILSSRAFIDYSTGGLENPLAHLLVALFWLDLLRDAPAAATRLVRLTLIASLVGITRQDLLILVVPGVLVEGWRLPWRRALPAWLAGVTPLIAWHAFSLFYYGFAFPNSAYAKLATSIPAGMLFSQGIAYLRASWESDPMTLLITAAGAVAACVHSRTRALALGVPTLLYLAYVVRVGGDYMNGRFLTAPFLGAVLALALTPWAARVRLASGLVAASMAVAIAMPESALRLWRTTWPPYGSTARYGVLNEQMDYYTLAGLIPMLRGAQPSTHPWARLGRELSSRPRVTVHTNVGLLGYYGGPAVHIIDEFGIGDLLLARLPASVIWSAGHYRRDVPPWYREFLERCIARLHPAAAMRPTTETCLPYLDELPAPRDAAAGTNGPPQGGDATPDSAAREAAALRLYRDLVMVSQGPLWSGGRLRAIVRLNLSMVSAVSAVSAGS